MKIRRNKNIFRFGFGVLVHPDKATAFFLIDLVFWNISFPIYTRSN